MKHAAVQDASQSDVHELLESGKSAKKPSLRRKQPHLTEANKVQLGVVEQVRRSFRAENRLATLVGFILGGFIPVASWELAHCECKKLMSIPALLVIGGLMFSAKTVFDWGYQAFGAWKAAGFVLLMEGVMVYSGNWTLNMVALGLLVFINGLGTGATLSLQRNNTRD
jgi:hypothetical protein